MGQRAGGAAARLGAGRPGGPAGAVQRPYPRRRRGRADRGRSGGRTGRTGTCRTWPGGSACTAAQLEALATADAFACFGLTRRQALWAAGAAAQDRPGRLPGTVDRRDGAHAARDGRRWTGWSPTCGPPACPRRATRPGSSGTQLDALGAVPIARLGRVEPGQRIRVGGIVTHRQRPATAGGVTFLNLEDETGMLNVTCSPGLWQRYRRGGPDQRRAGGPGPVAAARGGDQPDRRPAGRDRAAGQPGVPRLPLSQ